MTWHTEVVDEDRLVSVLGDIRATGGTIMRSCPCPAGYSVTYVTHDD